MYCNFFVFSKDRACQLDLLLRSMEEMFPIERKDVWVLYKASNGSYSKGYEILKERYSGVNFLEEINLLEQTRYIFNGFRAPLTLLSVDDNVFINTPDCLEEAVRELGRDPEVCAISVRLNPNVNLCQPADLTISCPSFIQDTPFLKWDWTKCDPRGCWGYPHPTDSNIYRTEYIRNLINTLSFKHSGNLEDQMNRNRDFSKPFMLSLKKSCLMSIPNNSTQAGWANVTGGDNNFGIEELNRKFLLGYEISTKNLYLYPNTACHTIVPYILEKKEIRANSSKTCLA